MLLKAIIALPLFLATSLGQLTFTVPVVDRSAPSSPLEISGTISFAESENDRPITSSIEYNVIARNLSQKTIVLLVASMDESAPHGKTRHHTLQFDNLFRLGFAPGESFTLAQDSPEDRVPACCADPRAPANDPHAEVHVEYVRFSDGSTFGDESAAKDILEVEALLLGKLRSLDATRRDQDFVKTLHAKRERKEVDAFLDSIRRVQRTKGTSTARKQVRAGLAHADKHLMESMTAQVGK